MNIPGMDQMLGGGVKGKLGKMAMNRMMKKKEEKEKDKQALVNYWKKQKVRHQSLRLMAHFLFKRFWIIAFNASAKPAPCCS